MLETDPTFLIEMRGIHKNFGAVQALRGVDLAICAGEVVGLVGDNAAGKSTLVKVLFGAYRPDAGEIYLRGKRVHFSSPMDARRARIEMIYQEFALAQDRDVTSNIFLGRELTRSLILPSLQVVDMPRMHAMATEALERLGIELVSTKAEVRELSGGQRQAVAIARTMSFSPSLIIMDEPTANLSTEKSRRVLDTISAVKDLGVSVILITHRIQDVFTVGDRMVVLWQGTKVLDAPTRDLTLEKAINYIVGGVESINVKPRMNCP